MDKRNDAINYLILRIYTKLWIVLLALLVFNHNVLAYNSFKNFLFARLLLHHYDISPRKESIDLTRYLNYKDVNLGFNNFRKFSILLSYYYKTQKKEDVKHELESYIRQGLLLENIPKELRADNAIFSESFYNRNRAIYTRKFNRAVFDKMLIIHDRDQKYRRFNMSKEDYVRQAVLDSINFLDLFAIERRYGWNALLEYNYDLYNNYDSCRSNWSIFTILGHLRRDQIIHFRQIAIGNAIKNMGSWDEVVLIQQYLAIRNPLSYTRSGQQFPLESISVKNNAISADSAFLELFVLGHVVLKGHRGMIIELFASDTAHLLFKQKTEMYLSNIRNKLLAFGLEANTVKVRKEKLYFGSKLQGDQFGYRILHYKGGVLNWMPPYHLIFF